VHHLTFVSRRLAEARALVPPWSRWAVAMFAIALAVTTFGYLALRTIGIDASGWGSWVYEICRPLCHQNPARSFHVSTYVFPLCARCTGMWLGITLGAAMAMLYRPRHCFLIGGLITVVGTAASAVDWLREGAGGTPSAWARAVFGFLLFLGVMLAVSYDVLAVLALFGRWIRRGRGIGVPPGG